MANVDESVDRSGAPTRKKRALHSPEGIAVLLFVGALAAGSLLWTRPRPFVPGDTPGMRLQGARASPRSTEAPSSELALETDSRIRAAGEAERDAARGTLTQDARGLSDSATDSCRRLTEEEGSDSVAQLRNAMTLEAIDALLGYEPMTERSAILLGAFGRHLDRYNARAEGSVRAPRVVLEAMFKARWNSIVSREPTDGLSTLEQQAYWGWLAFEGEAVEPQRRLRALDAYEEAGGKPVPEARAWLLHKQGRSFEAADVLRAAQSQQPNLRLRNVALAMIGSISDGPDDMRRVDANQPTP